MNWYEQGGSAFPIPHSNGPGSYECETGMSLRDWFAGQALAGIMSDESWHRLEPTFVAKTAVAMADAMLEARK